MANRNYIILEDKDGKEVLPVTDGNGVFVEGGTKKLESKLTEIDSKTTELSEQLDNNVRIVESNNELLRKKIHFSIGLPQKNLNFFRCLSKCRKYCLLLLIC